MIFVILFVSIITVLALVGTLVVTRDNDEKYRKSTKKNVTNLTSIYVVVILLGFIAVGVYISFLFQ